MEAENARLSCGSDLKRDNIVQMAMHVHHELV